MAAPPVRLEEGPAPATPTLSLRRGLPAVPREGAPRDQVVVPWGAARRLPRTAPRGRVGERGPARLHPGAVDGDRDHLLRTWLPGRAGGAGTPRRRDLRVRRPGHRRVRRCHDDVAATGP